MCIIDQPYLSSVRKDADPPLGVTSVLDIEKDNLRKAFLPKCDAPNFFIINIRRDNGRIIESRTIDLQAEGIWPLLEKSTDDQEGS